jgi:hypothetical protein
MRKKNLAEVLQTDVTTNLPVAALAQIVRSKGRGRDTVLAHITPREAKKLKREGGRGSINPDTGLPEFEDGFDFTPSFTEFPMSIDYSGYTPPTTEFTQLPETAYQAPSTGYEGPSSYGFYDYQPTVDMTSFTPSATPDFYGNTYYGDFSSPTAQEAQAFVRPQGAPLVAGAGRTAARPAPEAPYQARDLDEWIAGEEDALRRVGELEAARGETAKSGEKSIFDKLTSDPLKLALALGGAGLGLFGQSQARKQAADVTSALSKISGEQKALAAPFLQQGGLQYGLSTQGAMTPAAQQQFDVARAQLAQAAARSGSVGAMQATQIGEQLRQNIINSQLTQAMQILSQGNSQMNAGLQTDIAAINARNSMSQQANQAMMNMYGMLGKFIGG